MGTATTGSSFTGRAWVLKAIDDWLASDTLLPFLVVGLAGSGKSTLVSRLAAINAGDATAPTKRLRVGVFTHVHVCRAQDDPSLDAVRFVELLTRRLAAVIPGFSESLRTSVLPTLSVAGRASVGQAETGSVVAGVIIESLQIRGMSARAAFDRLVRRPLEGVTTSHAPVVVIDGLDESLVYGDGESVVDLIVAVSDSATDSSTGIRLLLTSRADDRVVKRIRHRPLDLVRDQPVEIDDVRDYALTRLEKLPSSTRATVAKKVADAAKGNFLYARYVLNELLSGPPATLASSEPLTLPDGLEAHYEEYLRRELTRRDERWEDRYRPLLALLSVGVGAGLSREHLVRAGQLAPSRVDDALKALSQYLTAPSADGPFQLYHESFREFLTSNPFFPIYPAEANAALGLYLLHRYAGNWAACDDDYAALNTLDHLTRAWTDRALLDPTTQAAVASARDELTSDANYRDGNSQARWIAEHAPAHVGREEVLAQIDHWAASSQTPVLLIVGPPGIGKTTLAAKIVQLTRQAQRDSRYPSLSSGVFSILLHISALEGRRGSSWLVGRLTECALARLRLISNVNGHASHNLGQDLRGERLEDLLLRLRTVESPDRLVVVVDALDELDDPLGDVPLRLARMAETGAFRLVVTTRAFPGIEAFPPDATTIISLAEMTPADTVAQLQSEGIPERDAEIIALRAEGNPLAVKLLAEAYREGVLVPEDQGADLGAVILQRLNEQIARAGNYGTVLRRVLVVLARHHAGLTASELAAVTLVPLPQVKRALDDLGPFVASDGAGRFRLVHQAVGDVIHSIGWIPNGDQQ